MFSKQVVLIVFVAFCGFIHEICGQDCVPSVKTITIGINATLWWEMDPDQVCEETTFDVVVEGDEDNYQFNVTANFVDLSFLEICTMWNFKVTPTSKGTAGLPKNLTAFIPVPPDADLSLGSFNFIFSGRNLLLQWDLRNNTLGECTIEYRLTLEDLERGTIDDVHVEGKSASLNILSPCVDYEVVFRVINQADPTIEGPLRKVTVRIWDTPQLNPILKYVDIQPTSINMTWTLEGDGNRCPLRTFYVDGGSYFNSTVPLQDLLDPTTVQVEIKSLLPNSMYYLRALVENSGGMSEATPIAVQTLDLNSN